MTGKLNGSIAVAKVSADRNHVGAFQTSAERGNQACKRVVERMQDLRRRWLQ